MSDILEKINALKGEYYSTNKKNILFKNDQKFDCANTIVQNMNMTELFNSIIQINNNEFLCNYSLFKTIINPTIYMDFIEFIFQINDKILQIYPTYNLYIDLKGLTMTGVERYKDFISLLSKEGQRNGKNFLQRLNHVYLTNPPFMIANIGKILLPLMDKVIKDKIIIQQ